ncbi:MAG: CinA family protein [Nitrospirae bacterium]|nr:CinA family protein [Nitrospirota bacterium]MCL5422685.1 CinA family protein [Nitrospirota bacterium]
MESSCIDTVERIHKRFKASWIRLCVAESCTGGLISHLITNLPGASLFFDSSVVSYSNESKIKFLGLKRSLIRKHGAVSEEVARAMAVAMREKRGTDFSLAITGNLGPDPMEDKKVGLVYMAVDFEKETVSRGMIFEGEREEIKLQAAVASLRFLAEVVETWT